MKAYIVDSSVAIKWYIPEKWSIEAVEWLESANKKGYRLLAPDLIFPEIGNVLWKKCRKGELAVEDARKILSAVDEAFPVRVVRSASLLPAAFEIAHVFNRSVYDSLYLALAKARGGVLVTADLRLANALQDTVLGTAVLFLGKQAE